MQKLRVLFAALFLAVASAACTADATGPVFDCPVMGAGGTCQQ